MSREQYAALSMGDPNYGGGYDIWLANQGNFNLTDSSTWQSGTGGSGTGGTTTTSTDQNPMSLNQEFMGSQKLGAISQIAKGGMQLIGSFVGSGKRRVEQQEAQAEFSRNKRRFEQLDTTNPYAGLTNAYEDLRVNQLEAQFLAQQQQLGLATTMSSLAGAAGGSGVASLAQAMANQQTRNLQQAAGRIGQQEAVNQRLMAQGQQRVDMMRAQGEYLSRQMEAGKTSQMYGIAQDRLEAANLARQQATAAAMGGIGNIAAGILGTGVIRAAGAGAGAR